MARESKRTVCNRDCPDACGLIATVEDGRVIHLAGDPDHPVTRGFLCPRTGRFPERQYSAQRITEPQIRRGGGFEPASWEEALGRIADAFLRIRAESGPAAIFHYRSGGSLGMMGAVVERFFERFGPVTTKRGDICSGAGDHAQETDFGEEESHDLFDLRNARSILLWGKNASVSNIHLLPVLREAQERGARVLLIDPVWHKTASRVEAFVQPRPGGDFHLAMAAARLLFDRGATDPAASSYCDGYDRFRAMVHAYPAEAWARAAGVSAEDASRIADLLAARPCAIQVGWGMGRRSNGSAIVRAIDALGAISGNLGIPGGGVSFYFKRRGGFDLSFLEKRTPRTLCEPLLGRAILEARDPEIRAVWVTAGNPVAQLPESGTVARALETREFVVVVDPFWTDTARRAHVVLPATTLLESDDLLGAYGNHWIGAAVPVVPPPPGVLSDLEIAQRLAAVIDARSGREPIAPDLAGSARDWKRRMLRKVEPHGVSLERLERESVRNPLASDVLFADRRFPTASGRVQLVGAVPVEPSDEPGFPLWVFSNSSSDSQCSQWAGPEPDVLPLTCHPRAAAGFAAGEEAWLESAVGRIRVRLRFDERQRADVAIVPKGGSFDRGTCANALVRARLTDAGEGAAYLDCRARLVR